jgi:hypothetical protein
MEILCYLAALIECRKEKTAQTGQKLRGTARARPWASGMPQLSIPIRVSSQVASDPARYFDQTATLVLAWFRTRFFYCLMLVASATCAVQVLRLLSDQISGALLTERLLEDLRPPSELPAEIITSGRSPPWHKIYGYLWSDTT